MYRCAHTHTHTEFSLAASRILASLLEGVLGALARLDSVVEHCNILLQTHTYTYIYIFIYIYTYVIYLHLHSYTHMILNTAPAYVEGPDLPSDSAYACCSISHPMPP